MQDPGRVFIVSKDQAIRNVLDQVFMINGYTPITAVTVAEAETMQAQRGLGSFALVVIDTDVLGEFEPYQVREAHRLLQDWTTKQPDLRFLFIGTVLQKYALLAAYDTIVPFVTKPLGLDELANTVCALLPSQEPPT
jgi:DNA-binding NtrC family response regulator